MSVSFQYPFAFSVRENYDFASFLAGAANAPLLAYLQAFPVNQDAFCLLWGQQGSGKTHLLQALCQAQAQSLYLPLEQLRGYGPEVLQGLAGHELLVLDDLDAVVGQLAWEECLFQIFDTALRERRKLCCASTLAPAALSFALPDLRSRLQLALTFELRPADPATRAALLQQVARRRGMELKDEVADYLLSRHQRDWPALLALLDQLDHSSLAQQRRLTIPFIKEQLGW
ncbi:MAG: DnaA regulatory inactivator Hda [Pseudomonadales bacterium]|nr:DnaA regulatory inactivator Hda [Pseudomonadales bacterium]